MPNNSVRCVARLIAKPDCVNQVAAILTDVLEPTRKESGCIGYELLQNRADPTDFTFVEEWATDAAIDAHLTTKHIQEALTKLAGLISSEPDIRTYRVVQKDN